MARATPRPRDQWILAERIRDRRRGLGLTQAAVVARLTRPGAHLTNRTLSAIENGRGLEIGRLPDLAAALECTVTYLLGLTDDPQQWEPDQPWPADAVRHGHPVPWS